MVPVKPRFPVLLAVPMTTDRGQPWVKASPDLYIRLAQGTGGLPSDSILLLDQARSLDATRVRRFLGTLDKETFNGVLGKWTALFKRG
jgi:mRNA interferase MazF